MRILLLVVLALVLASCSARESENYHLTAGDTAHSSRNSLDWAGEYADDSGRRVVVEKMGRISINGVTGTYHWDSGGDVIHSLVRGVERFMFVGEGYLEDVTYRGREKGRVYRKVSAP